MDEIESRIRSGLRGLGIPVHSVYILPGSEKERVLIAFKSEDNLKLTTAKVQTALNSLGVGEFSVPTNFERLSASFLHLEVVLGARMEGRVGQDAE
ncbi:MAG: hypothetical protein C4K47_08575 [Candidatus Thorarchaeota archaeon]|nr:MAG: hypothetical protein C4K47_08575 [Candidatus Thorarchaeota archaeon]